MAQRVCLTVKQQGHFEAAVPVYSRDIVHATAKNERISLLLKRAHCYKQLVSLFMFEISSYFMI